MKQARDMAVAAKLGVGLLKDRRFWKAAPRNPLTEQGYEEMPNLLTRESCERLVALADAHLRDYSYAIGDEAYLVRRRQGPRDYDTQISQVMHAQELDDELRSLAESGRVERLFQDRLGVSVVLETISIQVDDVDTETKRGYHVDRLTPPTLKLFTYLTDVEDDEDGPYTVIPGTHLDVTVKLRNVWHNMRSGRPWTDMSLSYRDTDSVRFYGPAGMTVISTQTLAHKGWQRHSRRRRICLICYVTPSASWSGKPFSLGRDFIETETAT